MKPWIWLVFAVALTACAETARLSVAEGIGPNPELPPPNKTFFPTINVAEATGWPSEKTPDAAPGIEVAAFADKQWVELKSIFRIGVMNVPDETTRRVSHEKGSIE